MKTDRRELGRGLALSPFLLAGILFLMPWVQVSCSGIPVTKLTGVDLAFGTSLEDPISRQAKQAIPSDWRARVVFLLVVAALPVALLPTRPRNGLLCSIAVAQVTLLLLMLLALRAEIRRPQIVPVSAEIQGPYWATLLSLAVGALLCGSQPLSRERKIQRRPTAAVSPGAAAAGALFCAHCGQRSTGGGTFCASCGQRLA